jgi:hypothetical protein
LESLFPADDWRVGTQSRILAIAGIASDDLWIGGRAFILHWDGVAWRSVPVPTKYDVAQFVVFSSTDILASDGGFLHWDGTSWTRLSIPAFQDDPESSIRQLWLDDQKRLWATMSKETRCQLYLLAGSESSWDGPCLKTQAKWSALSVGGVGSNAWVLEAQAPPLGRKFFQVERFDGESDTTTVEVPDSPTVDPQIATGPWRIQGLTDGQIWMPDEGAAWLWDGQSFSNATTRFPLPTSHSVMRLFQSPGSPVVWAIAGSDERAKEVLRSNDHGETWTTAFSR